MNSSAETIEQVNSMMESNDLVAETMLEPGHGNYSMREKVEKIVFSFSKVLLQLTGWHC